MKKSAVILALALGVSAWTAMAQEQSDPPPGGAPPPEAGTPPGAPPIRPGFHVLPPRAMVELNLTDDQKKQLADLEAEVKAKVEKILTPEQLEHLKQMHPPFGPGMGPRGYGRGPGGPPGAAPRSQPPATQQ